MWRKLIEIHLRTAARRRDVLVAECISEYQLPALFRLEMNVTGLDSLNASGPRYEQPYASSRNSRFRYWRARMWNSVLIYFIGAIRMRRPGTKQVLARLSITAAIGSR